MLYITYRDNPEGMRKADTLDREYLAQVVALGLSKKFIVNDELLETGDTLITVTKRAWDEMEHLVD